jgi:hypothetical protein
MTKRPRRSGSSAQGALRLPTPADAPLLDASVTTCDAAARALGDDKEWRRTSLVSFFSSASAGLRPAQAMPRRSRVWTSGREKFT